MVWVEPELAAQLSIAEQLVENVERPLRYTPACHASLFEQVSVDAGPADRAGGVESDADKLAKAGRVVVANRLGIAECLQDRIGGNDLVGQVGLLVANCRQ